MNTLRATRYLRPLNRKTDEHLIRACDGHYYSVTLEERWGSRSSLLNIVGGRLCEFAGIETAPPILLRVDLDIPRSSTGHFTREETRGIFVGNRYPIDPETTAIYDFIPDKFLHGVENRNDFWKLIPIDLWLGNTRGSRPLFYCSVPGTPVYRSAFLFRLRSGLITPLQSVPIIRTLPLQTIRHYCGENGYSNAKEVIDRLVVLKEAHVISLFDDLRAHADYDRGPTIHEVARSLIAGREALFVTLPAILIAMQHRIDGAGAARMAPQREVTSADRGKTLDQTSGATA